MKLNENKEKIPATFITSYIADAWEKVGYIKADIDAIKESYTGTVIVEDCLQGIIDAYLIAAGRLQSFLDNKNYVDIPEEKIQEALTEDLTTEDINIDKVEVRADNIIGNPEKLTVRQKPTKAASVVADTVRLPDNDEFEDNFEEDEKPYQVFDPYDFGLANSTKTTQLPPEIAANVSWYDLAKESNATSKRTPQYNPSAAGVSSEPVEQISRGDTPVISAEDVCSFDNEFSQEDVAQFQAMLAKLNRR